MIVSAVEWEGEEGERYIHREKEEKEREKLES